MSETTTESGATTRRAMLAGAAGVGAAAALAACGSGSDSGSGDSGGAATPTGNASGGASGVLAKTSDVPVNGGFINQSAQVVITQPTQGEYKAFSAVCTHQQCIVGSVSNNVITCPCHMSQYSAVDGSVKQGPAPKALTAMSVKVEGANIIRG
jgi:Rieske Fe-S protein